MSKIKKNSKKAVASIEETLEKIEDTIEEVADKAKTQVQTAAKETKKAVRSTQKKVTAALVPEVYVQWNDSEVSMADIIEKAKEDFKAEHSDLILSCRVYVKPQDNMAYYVINDVEGKVSL